MKSLSNSEMIRKSVLSCLEENNYKVALNDISIMPNSNYELSIEATAVNEQGESCYFSMPLNESFLIDKENDIKLDMGKYKKR